MSASQDFEFIVSPSFRVDEIANLVIDEVYPSFYDSRATLEDFWLANPIDTNIAAITENKVYGVAGLTISGAEAELQYLAVHKSCRNAGLGGALVCASEEVALTKGCRRMRVISTAMALPFYISRGFKPVTPDDVELEKYLLQ